MLVVLIIIGTTFYIKRQRKDISQETLEACPTTDLETECFSEKCFADIKCFDEVPSDDIWDKDMWDKE